MTRQNAQFLWVGNALSEMEHLCLNSFVKVGYDVSLYVYNTLENCPAGVVYKDASKIIPEREVFLGPGSGKGSYANFSDRFRYYLLYEKGGWWFDTDHVAIRIRPEPTELLIASQWEGINGEYACPGALWCKPGDPHMKWLKENADRILQEDVEDRPYTALGPMLVNNLVDTFSLRDHVAPWWEFNPYPHFMVHRLAYQTNTEWLVDRLRFAKHVVRERFDKDFRAAYIRPGTRAVHLSNEIWRAQDMDKNAVYHPRSLYGRMQRKYGSLAAGGG